MDEQRRARFEQDAVPLLDAMYGGAISLTRNRADADDLIQETFMKAFRNFEQFQDGTNLKAWLHKIMFNAFISSYRKKRHAPESVAFDEMLDVGGGTTYEHAVNERNAWLDLADASAMADFRQQLPGELKSAIDSLPDDFRHVLILNTINELSYREVAETLGIPIGTVMSRLSRAKSMVRDRLLRARDGQSTSSEPAVPASGTSI